MTSPDVGTMPADVPWAKGEIAQPTRKMFSAPTSAKADVSRVLVTKRREVQVGSLAAHPNRWCGCGLNPPVSSSYRAM